MVSFPNGKINIGLHVVNKRDDGFHDIETVFFPVQSRDAIEIIEDKKSINPINFSQTGTSIPGFDNDNLCIKAYHILKGDFPQLPNIKMHLHKNIPLGAGLGGGSADASFMLKLINQKFDLNLSNEKLIHYAQMLGSDCPFFILNKPCYATGRGEILEELTLDLSSYSILLVNPGIHINTGQAFSAINIKPTNIHLKELIFMPIEEWQNQITNDFEIPVFKAQPEIAEIKKVLANKEAVYTAMSGSGSTVYGIFKKEKLPILKFPPHYFCKWV